MTNPAPADATTLREILSKNWMTHDAMWFFHCMQECGMEATNRINRAAVRSMARIEVQRLLKAQGLGAIRSFEDLRIFTEGAESFVKPSFMRFQTSYPAENTMRWEWEPGQCFAFKGLQRFGLIDQYECGIFDRPEAWFDELGLEWEVTPRVTGCMMHTQGTCHREYRFRF